MSVQENLHCVEAAPIKGTSSHFNTRTYCTRRHFYTCVHLERQHVVVGELVVGEAVRLEVRVLDGAIPHGGGALLQLLLADVGPAQGEGGGVLVSGWGWSGVGWVLSNGCRVGESEVRGAVLSLPAPDLKRVRAGSI